MNVAHDSLAHRDTSVSDQSRVKQHVALVLENRVEKPRYHRLLLQAPLLSAAAQPGQYVHIRPPAVGGFDPLLRRAFSIMSAENDQVEILFRVEGRGTRLLSEVAEGAVLDVLGPLGRPFEWQQPDSATETILVGGGVGAPPLVFFARSWTGAKALTVLLGAKSEADLIGVDDFRTTGARVEIATDDGSVGTPGLVTSLLERRLSQATGSGLATVVHACGPWPMLRAVAALSAQYDACCFVSLEENMPCGIGVCNGCVVPVLTGEDDYGRYRRICVEGPVMDAGEVDWARGSGPPVEATSSNTAANEIVAENAEASGSAPG